MTVKEYLSQVQTLTRRERLLRETIEETETALTSISMDYSKERVDGGRGDDRIALLERLDDLTNQLAHTLLALSVTKARIALQVQSLSKDVYIHVLSERYIKGRRLQSIAEDQETKYCNVHIYRLHGEALQEFAERFAPFDENML